MTDIFNYIDERWQEMIEKHLRPGFYAAKVSNALQSLRRVAIDAEWGATWEQARRISSPLLDVIPEAGSRVAVISQDGVPEFPAVFGKIWDDAGPVDQMTAWLRANLEEHAGHLELGADKGIRIQVGKDTTTITETNDGEIVIESAQGDVDIRVQPDGTVRMAGGTELLARASDVESELSDLWSALEGHKHTDSTGGATSPPDGKVSPTTDLGSAGDVESPSIYGD